MANKKIVLFGGTFDPIHVGHVAVANFAAAKIKAEKIFFIPSKHSPLKKIKPSASSLDRSKMISLALRDYKNTAVSDCELNRSGPSYTIDTVKFFRSEYGRNAELYWLIGADCLADITNWYQIKTLLDECVFTVMTRAGVMLPDLDCLIDKLGKDRVGKLQQNVIKTPLVNVSSTEVRKRLSQNIDVSEMICPAVEKYIHTNRLYQ